MNLTKPIPAPPWRLLTAEAKRRCVSMDGRHVINQKQRALSGLIIEWLEATFPQLTKHGTRGDNLLEVKAHPYALLESSLALQGPFYKAYNAEGAEGCVTRRAKCKDQIYCLLYSLVGKYSILIPAWSAGKLEVDEIQPVWISGELLVTTSNLPLDHTIWLGNPPPLLRLANIDLAHPTKRASQVTRKDEALNSPSVDTVLSTCHEDSAASPLLDFMPLSDLFGYAWIIAVLSSGECILTKMKTWDLLLWIHVGTYEEETRLHGIKLW